MVSILCQRRNLVPVIHTVRKTKINIISSNAYIRNSKFIPKLFIYRATMEKKRVREQQSWLWGWEGWDVMERAKYGSPGDYHKDSWTGICQKVSRNATGHFLFLSRGGRKRDGREVSKGGYIHHGWFMLRLDWKQQKIL